jgi:hypothetical protein
MGRRRGRRGAANCGGGQRRIHGDAVAVNAESMATWFDGAFEALDDVVFDIRIEDQDHSARLLREGVVMGAVTTSATRCRAAVCKPLGVMRYIAVASTAYMKRCLPEGFTAHVVALALSLAWNRDDALQDMLVQKVFRRDSVRPQHFIPTAEGSARLCALGWDVDVPGQPRRTAPGRRLVQASGRRSPRRTAVLAVLESRQPDRRPDQRRGAISRQPAPALVIGPPPTMVNESEASTSRACTECSAGLV